ncbi:MAG: hypothetical protein APR62_12905 [Smithella sp. SDB]|nr:MAG: hypothetical protein APR62_12905 [Smithella sp. SDB]
MERLFKTLQDRLVKELRLSGAKNCEDANRVLSRYLVVFNHKFSRAVQKSGDYHRNVDASVNLDEILAVQTARTLRGDRTVLYEKHWYQVLTKTRAARVTVYNYLNGRMVIKNRECVSV